MFDSRDFFSPKNISSPKDTEIPIKSTTQVSLSSSIESSSPVRSTTPPSDYLFDESIFAELDNSLWSKSDQTGKMPPKRTSTSAAPAMTQDVIRQLVADSVATVWSSSLFRDILYRYGKASKFPEACIHELREEINIKEPNLITIFDCLMHKETSLSVEEWRRYGYSLSSTALALPDDGKIHFREGPALPLLDQFIANVSSGITLVFLKRNTVES
ncbi:hypothetical protein Tco_0635552 [Tanacetum coccineum]